MIGDQPQIGEGILDFLTLEEAQTTVDSIRQLFLHQCFFQNAGLGVIAVQNGGVQQTVTLFAPGFQASHHKPGLIQLVERGIDGNGFTRCAIGPEFFTQTRRVVGDQLIGSFQNRAGGAVILFQTNGLYVVKILHKALDVLDTGTAPAIDRLIIVTDNHDLAAVSGEQADPGILNAVGILKFIDQNMAEALLVVFQQMWFMQPQLMRP